MNRTLTLTLAALLLAPAAARAADGNNPAAALSGQATMLGGSGASILASEKAKKKSCAVVLMAGPAASDNIFMALNNLTESKLVAVTIDPFQAYGGKSLIIADGGVVGPFGGGTSALIYPNADTGAGPAVLGFTDFNQDDYVLIGLDPDTYTDPDFDATVKNMDGTRIEAAFAGGRRCAGTLKFDASLNLSVAKLTRTSP